MCHSTYCRSLATRNCNTAFSIWPIPTGPDRIALHARNITLPLAKWPACSPSFPVSIFLFFACPNNRDFWLFQGQCWKLKVTKLLLLFLLLSLTQSLRETKIIAHFFRGHLKTPRFVLCFFLVHLVSMVFKHCLICFFLSLLFIFFLLERTTVFEVLEIKSTRWFCVLFFLFSF